VTKTNLPRCDWSPQGYSHSQPWDGPIPSRIFAQGEQSWESLYQLSRWVSNLIVQVLFRNISSPSSSSPLRHMLWKSNMSISQLFLVLLGASVDLRQVSPQVQIAHSSGLCKFEWTPSSLMAILLLGIAYFITRATTFTLEQTSYSHVRKPPTPFPFFKSTFSFSILVMCPSCSLLTTWWVSANQILVQT